MSFFETYRPWIYLTGGFVGYLLIMFTNPARESLRDGFRCICRYRRIWMTLALFGLCYALFVIGRDVFEYYKLNEGERPVFQWSRPWFLTHKAQVDILESSCLPALEGVTGLFNVIITTFPFSAIAALLFLVNWQGHHGVLARAVSRRFRGFGVLVYTGILLCAVAALLKPLLYTPLLPKINEYVPGLLLLQCSYVIDWLSFLFEIMFGVCVQIYLILMVYAWVRGLNFTHQHLLDFAIRRFSFAMKWSAIVMLVSSLCFNLPRLLAIVPPFSHHISEIRVLDCQNLYLRPAMVVFLLLFAGMQIVLTFHSESLGKALRDYFHFLRKDWWAAGWFLLVALIHFYFLNVADAAVKAGFSSLPEDIMNGAAAGGTAVTIAWSLFYPLLAALVGGWLLAGWVCLYKRSEAGNVQAENWVKY